MSWFPEPSTQPPLSKGAYRQEIAHLRQGLLAAPAELLEAPHWLRTHTEHAPRTEIDADDERAARVAVSEAIADALERQITAREAASRSDDDSAGSDRPLAHYRSGDARVS